MQYGLFLGCNMPAHRPDIERSIRATLTDLHVDFVDVDGYVCCPGFGTFPAVDQDAQLVTNAWNYAIAEEKGIDLITQCGSCYSSMKLGRATLLEKEGTKDRINKLLAVGDKKYEGRANMRHMIDLLYSEVGPERIREAIKTPLTGARIVVQYPCHTRFPSELVGFDESSGRPDRLRKLVEALGATVETYSLEYGCCGGSGGFHKTSAAEAESFTKRKYEAIRDETECEAIVGSCITCVMYMDRVQKLISTEEEKFSYPVFDYNQLLALCMGYPPSQVARISVEPREAFIQKYFG